MPDEHHDLPSDIASPAHRLVFARQRAGYATASEAARAFGWNENTYRSHENGERGIRLDVARQYSKAFRIDTKWIFFGTSGPIKEIIKDHNYLKGGVDSNLIVSDYPLTKTGNPKFRADSSYNTEGLTDGIEINFKVPMCGLYPGDLLLVFQFPEKWARHRGRLAVLEIEDGSQRLHRFDPSDSSMKFNVAPYGDDGPIFVPIRKIFLVGAIVQAGFWEKREAD